MNQRSFYDFTTLQEAVDFFKNQGIPPSQVYPGGGYGGPNTPKGDDDVPVFFWEAP